MIPFARVLNYGNTASPPLAVKKAMASDNGTFILKGDILYYYGRNLQGEAAQGDNVPKSSWVIVSYDVDDFYAYDGGVILHRTDGSIWSSGRCVWFDSRTISNVLVNRDVWFSSISWDNIRNMSFCTNGTIFVVTTDNNLYGASGNGQRGVLGNGSPVSIYQLTLLLNNVQSAVAALNDSAYVSTDGRLFSTGWNDQGIHGNGNRTQINTWKLQDSGVTHYALSNHIFLYKNATSYKSCGSSPSFSRSAGSSYVWETISSSVLNASSPLYFLLIPGAATSRSSQIVLSVAQKLAVGSNTINMGIGRAGSASTPDVVLIPIDLMNIKSMTISVDNGVILSNDGVLYCTGTALSFPTPTGTDQYSYIEVETP